MTPIKKLRDISSYCTDKILKSEITVNEYISTTNMLADMKGVELATFLPPSLKLNKYEPKDILIANIRPYFKKIWQADKTGGCDADVLNIRADKKEVLPEYLYYALFKEEFFDYIMVGSKGVKMPRGDKEFIMNYEVPIPLFQKQEEIVSKIKPFFEKIESNNVILSNLEEYSQLLFHKWFVDFNFPDENSNPYKDAGGEMVEVDGKMIPKGWSIPKFGELVSLKNGLNYSADNEKEPNAKIISVKQLVRNTVLSEEIADNLFLSEGISDDYKIMKYDTIIARSASPGESALALDDLNVYYSGFSIRIRPKNEIWKYLTYFNTLRLKRMITSHSDGTIIKNITQQSLSNFKIITPVEQVVIHFNEIVEPILMKIKTMNKENQLLEETRDLLIKKLIK